MEMTMRLPANYNVMSADEMTYTCGGDATSAASVLKTVFDVVATGVVILNWADLLIEARSWLTANKTGDIVEDAQKGVEAWVEYTTSSIWNGVRSISATLISFMGNIPLAGSGAVIPYGPVVTALALLTA